MNYLFCSAGRRVELLKDFRKSISMQDRIIATDFQRYAPALQAADKKYLVPKITDTSYIDRLLDICQRENIDAIFTMFDPEIELLAKNRGRFTQIGVQLFVPDGKTAELCFDKYKMYKYLKAIDIPTPLTFGSMDEFQNAHRVGEIQYPVFVKPRTGSGSVGARRVDTEEQLQEAFDTDPTLIVQEYMCCDDIDVDIYVDAITHEAVSAFAKRKIETKIGGANKTISFVDEKLIQFIKTIIQAFTFYGAIDMDLFYKNEKYYLSEINPRFGGAYLHAYGAGVDFIKMIQRNLRGIANEPDFGTYPERFVMMMYDSVIFGNDADLVDVEIK